VLSTTENGYGGGGQSTVATTNPSSSTAAYSINLKDNMDNKVVELDLEVKKNVKDPTEQNESLMQLMSERNKASN
jgi:hypothetical protein